MKTDMKDLSPMEKEMFNVLHDISYEAVCKTFHAEFLEARTLRVKAAASLCSEKIKRAIELARELMTVDKQKVRSLMGNSTDSIIPQPFTEQEIIDKLSNPKS